MKSKILLSIALLSSSIAFSQKNNVGIGTTKPDESALLDVSSSNKGLLMPRMTLQQRNNISNPAKGLIVYQTDMVSGFYYFDGSEWKGMGNSEKSVAGTDGDWTLIGNSGTNPASNFIGTTDNTDLVFKVNGSKSGTIDANGTTLFGLVSGLNYDTHTSATFDENSGFGAYTLFSNTPGTGTKNTAVGFYSLKANTTGYYNSAVGRYSLFSNTTGARNVAVGGDALGSNTTGNDNMAIGFGALYFNVTGIGNMAIGSQSLNKVTGSNNTAVGYQSGFNTTGSGNIFIGTQAGYSETSSSNKLYIANTNTTTPLVYGDLSADFLAVGGVDATAAKRDNLSTSYGLLVRKGILTEKIKVATMTSTDWADYVFEKDYKIMPLDAVEVFIKENKHLPNVPTTEEMMKNGNDLLKTDAKLLEKIEELTLYMIEMNKEIKSLKLENEQLRKEVRK